MQLFTRNRRIVEATPLARLIVEHAERVLHTMDSLDAQIGVLKNSNSGGISFGIGVFAAYHLLNPILVKLQQHLAEARVDAVVAPLPELNEKLRGRQIDFFIGANDPLFQDEDFKSTLLFSEELMVACRRDHPLNQQAEITHLDILKYPAITYDGRFLKRKVHPLLSSADEFELLERNCPAIDLQHPWILADFVSKSEHIFLSTKAPLKECLQTHDLITLVPTNLDVTVEIQLVERQVPAATPLYGTVLELIHDVISEQGLS